MPMFIKMGLNGTGYIGKKESSSRAARMYNQRRKVLKGFPIETPFESIIDVRKYMSGDTIICLLCGKNYKKLANHIEKIHGMTPDEYHKKYNIPWTYGLVCKATNQAYSNQIRKRMESGWNPPIKTGQEQLNMVKKPRRKRVFIKEVGLLNLGDFSKPKHPLTLNENGEPETFTQRKERMISKRGSPEFKEKMKSRPQCQPDIVGERIGNYWKGRKQTPEHIAKRQRRRIT
jgi:hypothetical protein